MPSKQIATGTVVKINYGSGLVTENLVQSVTSPPRTREQIEADSIGDTFSVPELGIEEKSEYPMVQFWHPGDTEHEKLDTAFGGKTELTMQIVTPHSTAVTEEFTAKVTALEPEELSKGNVYKRNVTFVRTGAITRT